MRKPFEHEFLNFSRYSRHDKRSKLPGWILAHLRDAHLNLSTDMALHIAREVVFTFNFFYSVLSNGMHRLHMNLYKILFIYLIIFLLCLAVLKKNGSAVR